MELTFPDTTDTIDQIRNAIGRAVSFYSENKTPCSGCSIDPVTDTSVNSFCPVCSGVGYVITLTETVISGHVTHGPLDKLAWVTGGQLLEGESRVQIKYTLANLNTVDTAKYFVADGKRFDKWTKILRGVPEVNRILLDAKERI